jgi:hypothetical protein
MSRPRFQKVKTVEKVNDGRERIERHLTPEAMNPAVCTGGVHLNSNKALG